MNRWRPARPPSLGARRFRPRLTWVGIILLGAVLTGSCREPQLVSHFYYVNEPSSWNSLQANVAQIQMLSPQWFSVNGEGKLASTLDPAVVELARKQGVSLFPLLVNEGFDREIAHTFLTTQALQAQVISDLLQIALQNNFRGVQLDFENLEPDDRKLYTKFVKKLSKAFRKRRLQVGVAVPAPLVPAPVAAADGIPISLTWLASETAMAFDYRALSRAADFITLMAYDQYYTDPGPVAGLPWVEACLQVVLKRVSRKKMYLGIPLYYRRWNGEERVEGTYPEALALAQEQGVNPELNPIHRELYFRFEASETPNVVWLQDAGSVRERLLLARKYRLRGFSAWRLGHEDPQAWTAAFPAAAKP